MTNTASARNIQPRSISVFLKNGTAKVVASESGSIREIQMVAAMATAIAATAMAAPAVAAQSRIAIVNGIPVKKVDICLNGVEIRSNLRYGGKIFRVRADGTYLLKVFASNAGTCTGTKLAQKSITLAADDLTIVATRNAPKVLIFDNEAVNDGPGPGQAAIVWRHAADLGDLTFHAQLMVAPPIAPPPDVAADPIWTKRDQLASVESILWGWDVFVTRPNAATELASKTIRALQADRRHEWIMLGKKNKNAKLISFIRTMEAP